MLHILNFILFKSLFISSSLAAPIIGAEQNSQACQEFFAFATNSQEQSQGLKTESLVVLKKDQLTYEFYDGVYGPSTPHSLWSISKTITATLLGIAIQDQKVRLEDPISLYFPAQKWRKNTRDVHLFNQITINDLLYYTGGFYWHESPSDRAWKTSILNLLYGPESQSMLAAALTAPLLAEGPGKDLVYSSANSIIIQGILQKVYGSEYATFPWKRLFKPLGIQTAVFEKDETGLFVGGSHVFMAPRDLAKLGLLYMNDGIWNRQRLLPKGWMKKMLTVSPAQSNAENFDKNIGFDGVVGGTLWLNRSLFHRPPQFPNLPEDTYFASGRFGQWLLMFPSQKLIIARNGYDIEYTSKLNLFGHLALKCFAPEFDVSSGVATGPEAQAFSSLTALADIHYLSRTGLYTSLLAKELCSCHYVSGLNIYKDCVKRSGIPRLFLNQINVVTQKTDHENTLEVQYFKNDQIGYESSKAIYNPHYPEVGCRLVK